MQQISESDLRIILKFTLGRLMPSTFKAMASGHQGTRDRALDAAVYALTQRMKDWEIIVPGPQSNIFSDLVPGELARLRESEAARRGS